MAKSLKVELWRLGINLLFPAYVGTGAWVQYIADDFKEIRLKLPLSWRTKNYVGTIFGGSMYAAIDPFYMIMLIKNLGGKEYVVWDKAANIRFRRPGRETLYAKFLITDEELAEIKLLLETQKSVDRTYHVELVNKEGVAHAIIEKTVYVAKKREINSQK
jgi:acyl-coenzyme A thioesterase PaaI-like protein